MIFFQEVANSKIPLKYLQSSFLVPEAGVQVRDGVTHLKSNFGFMGTLIIFSMRIQMCSLSLFLEINVQFWVFLHIKSESLMTC